MENLPLFHSTEKWEVDTCEPLKKASREGALTYLAYGRHSYPGDTLPVEILPEISNIGFWDSRKEQNWGLDWHRNEGVEFTFVLNGTVTFQTTQETHNLETGVLAVTPPWMKHKLGAPNIGASKLFWIILDVQVRRPNEKWVWPDWLILSSQELAKLEELILSRDFTISVNKETLETIKRLQGLLEEQKVLTHPSQLKLTINQLLLDLLTNIDPAQPVRENTLKTKTDQTLDIFLQELPNYLSTPWSLDLMATECGMGKTVFTKAFKEKTNKTPMQYLNELRLETACAMLARESYLIKEIAEALGFSNTDYFCKCFRKKFKVSPGQYNKASPL